MNAVLEFLRSLIAAIPFGGASWFVILTLGFFVWLFSKGNKNPKSSISWEDLFLSEKQTHVNGLEGWRYQADPYKIGYLVGCIVGTWIMVQQADSNKLGFDMFGDYLLFLLGGAGMSNYFKRSDQASDQVVTAVTAVTAVTPDPDQDPPIPKK